MKFVGEFVSRSAVSRAFRVAALDHEIGNHAMEDSPVVKRLPRFGALRETDEVLHCDGDFVGEKLELELAFRGIEESEYLVGHLCDCSKLGIDAFIPT